MESFFTKQETESKSRPEGKILSCTSCGLMLNSINPRMSVQGQGKKGILIIGKASDKIEDKTGKLWRNDFGKFLSNKLSEIGIDLYNDCWLQNSVRCASAEPTNPQIDCCRRYLLNTIEKYKPKIIIVLGHEALYACVGRIWLDSIIKGKYDKWCGVQIPITEFSAYVCPLYNPEDIMDSGYKQKEFSKHLEALLPLLSSKRPTVYDINIEIISDLSILNTISAPFVSIDYETTGIKPYAAEHRIVCAAVCDSPTHAYVFMMPKNKIDRQPFIDLLRNPNIKKTAHNLKFENNWTNVKLNTKIKGWFYDTMIGSHILNSHIGTNGLKFQTFINFGIGTYNNEIEPYLQSVNDKDSNSLNRIDELLKSQIKTKLLLEYCAKDTIYQYWLTLLHHGLDYRNVTIKQIKDMVNNKLDIAGPILKFSNAYDLFHKGMISFSYAEQIGLRIDVDYCNNEIIKIDKTIATLESDFFNSKFYKHWQHYIGGKKPNLNSPDQLANFLYNGRKIKPLKFTSSGKGATDEEALRLLNIKELDELLRFRKLKKLKSTYLEAYLREQIDGYIHPIYNLHTVKTYRSSSDSPNFQNIPKRDKEAQKIIRNGIFPRPGHQLMEIDFSQLEVSIAACYHKDPVMLDYLIHKKDMHGDMAKQIFMIDNFNKDLPTHSLLRKASKNGFVFPQFYGDYYGNNAAGLCEWIQLPTKSVWKKDMGVKLNDTFITNHLFDYGIKSYADFVQHLKEIEYDFWNNRFSVYAKWKKKWVRDYQKNMEMWSLSGFHYSGEMKDNQIINHAIQGTAFHCLLWTFIECDRIFTKHKMQTKLIGQIHDAAVLDIYPPELDKVKKIINFITTKKLQQTWDWIIVPLSVEAELGGVDESWAQLKLTDI